jgi:hypothetical protein
MKWYNYLILFTDLFLLGYKRFYLQCRHILIYRPGVHIWLYSGRNTYHNKNKCIIKLTEFLNLHWTPMLMGDHEYLYNHEFKCQKMSNFASSHLKRYQCKRIIIDSNMTSFKRFESKPVVKIFSFCETQRTVWLFWFLLCGNILQGSEPYTEMALSL